MGTGVKTSGGEGGIRTLGTGVSPYNGLAKGSFSHAPLCAPHRTPNSLRVLNSD
jgi:hypothetical protein